MNYTESCKNIMPCENSGVNFDLMVSFGGYVFPSTVFENGSGTLKFNIKTDLINTDIDTVFNSETLNEIVFSNTTLGENTIFYGYTQVTNLTVRHTNSFELIIDIKLRKGDMTNENEI